MERYGVVVVLARHHSKVKELCASSQSGTKGLDSITRDPPRHPPDSFPQVFPQGCGKLQDTLRTGRGA